MIVLIFHNLPASGSPFRLLPRLPAGGTAAAMQAIAAGGQLGALLQRSRTPSPGEGERRIREALAVPLAVRRSEAAELALHDLDAQLVAGTAHVGQRHVEIARDLERLGARQMLLVAGLRLEGLDETGDVACGHEASVPPRARPATGRPATRADDQPGLVSLAKT